jgi:hypothetical protein
MNPKRVEVTMSFSENRTGDFGGFKPFSYIQGENLAGWEAVMEERTLDPWNSTFGDYDADLRNLDAWEAAQAAAAADRQAAGNKGNLTNQQIVDLAKDPQFG